MNERASSTNQDFYKTSIIKKPDQKVSQSSERSKSQINGCSNRFNQSSDPNNLNSLLFVNTTSTQ